MSVIPRSGIAENGAITEKQPSNYEHICKGVIRSMKENGLIKSSAM